MTAWTTWTALAPAAGHPGSMPGGFLAMLPSLLNCGSAVARPLGITLGLHSRPYIPSQSSRVAGAGNRGTVAGVGHDDDRHVLRGLAGRAGERREHRGVGDDLLAVDVRSHLRRTGLAADLHLVHREAVEGVLGRAEVLTSYIACLIWSRSDWLTDRVRCTCGLIAFTSAPAGETIALATLGE